ncbi:MAG: sugar transferase [Proteobacteria bacterium]|nr:sugar transferase [Pseudomonadota bacterium]
MKLNINRLGFFSFLIAHWDAIHNDGNIQNDFSRVRAFPENFLKSFFNQVLFRTLDLTIVFLLLIPAICIMGFYYVLYLIFNRGNGSFIYSGKRLGKNKKLFNIYKIRTLKLCAEKQFKTDVLCSGSGLELKFGKFLRSTRLDELPQLFNIFKGDLAFVGPRPERPALYKKQCKNIPGYDLRFSVRPGLIGPSQVLTPHSTPKRIRAFIDNQYITKDNNLFNQLSFFIWVFLKLSLNLVKEVCEIGSDHVSILSKRGIDSNKRKLKRIKNKNAVIYCSDECFEKLDCEYFEIVDMNNEAIHFLTERDLSVDEELNFVIEVNVNRKNKKIKKSSKCKAVVYKKNNGRLENSKNSFVAFYEPISSINQYIMDQYILSLSIAKINQ